MMHQAMAAALDAAIEDIGAIQGNARKERRQYPPPLADDRAPLAQGLDGTESGRRATGRGHLPLPTRFLCWWTRSTPTMSANSKPGCTATGRKSSSTRLAGSSLNWRTGARG